MKFKFDLETVLNATPRHCDSCVFAAQVGDGSFASVQSGDNGYFVRLDRLFGGIGYRIKPIELAVQALTDFDNTTIGIGINEETKDELQKRKRAFFEKYKDQEWTLS